MRAGYGVLGGVLALAQVATMVTAVRFPDVALLAAGAVGGGSVAVVPRFPRVAHAVAVLGYVAMISAGVKGGGCFFAVVITAYAVAVRGWWGWAGFGMAASVAVELWARLPADHTVATAVMVGAAALLGHSARQTAIRAGQLEQRLHELRSSQASLAAATATAERGRVARYLHDVVIACLGGVRGQAVRARRLLTDDDRAAAKITLGRIESASRDTLAEMRGVLKAIRAPAETPTWPGIDQVGHLVSTVRASGVSVRFEQTGTPVPLPAGTDRAAYRIVEEALANVLQHAGDATVRVTLAYTPAELVIDVVNGPGWTLRKWSVGHGLTAMREHAVTNRGQFSATPLPDGGFHVTATLPL